MSEQFKPGDYIGLYIDNVLIYTGILKDQGVMQSRRKMYSEPGGFDFCQAECLKSKPLATLHGVYPERCRRVQDDNGFLPSKSSTSYLHEQNGWLCQAGQRATIVSGVKTIQQGWRFRCTSSALVVNL